MKVLVTGSAGRIGRAVCSELVRDDVVTFDVQDGDDVLDRPALRRAIDGCDAVVHLASIIDDGLRPPQETLGLNIAGLWSVLDAAVDAKVQRFVFMSSIQALGLAKSYRAPDYLPIDDDHPSYAVSPYGLSKILGEQASEIVSRVSGMTTICLRPPHVLAPEEYTAWFRRRLEQPEDLDTGWNYGSWIDVRDVATAVRAALERSLVGHHTLLICADDISSIRSGDELATEMYPGVPRRKLSDDPYESWVDTSRAKRILDWTPAYKWQAWQRQQFELDARGSSSILNKEGAASSGKSENY